MPDLTPRLNDSDNTLLKKICLLLDGGVSSGVLSFNTRTGAVALTLSDVTTLVDSRYVLKAGDTMTGALVVQGALTGRTFTNTTGNSTFTTDDSATTFAYATILRKRGTTGNASAAVTVNSEMGQIVFQAWNGAAYVNSARVMARAGENQSSGHAAGYIEFATCPVASATVLTRCFVSPQGNIVLGNSVTVEPTSLIGGVVFKDTTGAASADPTTGSAIWSVGGVLQYRTSGASEGSGITGQVHNRAAQQAGVGTDYSLTQTPAQVAFGTTNAAVTLPTAGTYLVQACVSIIDGANSGDVYSAKLRNTTDSTDVGVLKKNSGSPAAGRLQIILFELVTTTAANKTVSIFAANETAVRGSVESTSTDIRYVRLF
jgi:hypothetical protein